MKFVLKNIFFAKRLIILTTSSLKNDSFGSLVILRVILFYYLPVRMDLLTWERPLSFPNVMTTENVSVNTNVNLLPLCIRVYHTIYLVDT